MNSDLEMDELGKELSILQAFECAADDQMMSAAARPREEADEVLTEWAGVLSIPKLVVASAALRINDADEEVAAVCMEGPKKDTWPGLLSSHQQAVAKAVRERASLRHPLGSIIDEQASDGFWMLTAACPGIHPPTSLAVIAEAGHASLAYRMVDSAAIRAAVQLSGLMAERARATMAARISQMCSSSIHVAQLRLDRVLRGNATAQEMAEEIRSALLDMEEAQRGFDRARLLGIPWSRSREDIRLGRFLAEIADRLRGAAGVPVADVECINVLRGQEITVSAAETRLSYALRDLLFGLWLITGKSSPVQIGLRQEAGMAVLKMTAGRLALQSDVEVTGENIGKLLKDPEVFLTGPDEHKIERLIGFQLAWKLIEEMDGTLEAQLADVKLTMTVNIPQSGRLEKQG